VYTPRSARVMLMVRAHQCGSDPEYQSLMTRATASGPAWRLPGLCWLLGTGPEIRCRG